MQSSKWDAVIAAIEQRGVTFESGLAPDELAGVEKRYDFLFPPDLREFLLRALPVSDDFPNWRSGEIKRGRGTRSIVELLDWPAEGICFDVEHDGFWVQDWGPKPDVLQEAFQVARKMVKQAPPLIPVFSHRFLPAEPATAGNPVLSVYQTDIIYYGMDLTAYFANEFKFPLAVPEDENMPPRRIRFWSDIIDGADGFDVYHARRSNK
jgi:hypothetical protein